MEVDVPTPRPIRVLPLAALALLACGGGDAPPAAPALPVTVAEAKQETIPVYLDHVGTTESVNSVEVRARVHGVLEKVLLHEGADVEAGEPLFVIEPATYRTALEKTRAELGRAKATRERTLADYERTEELTKRDFSSKADLDHARTSRDEAAASVAAAEAAVKQAELDLTYTEVRAPIAGRLGRVLVNQGNLVGGNEETVLTTLVQLDPIYSYFSASEKERLDVLRQRKEGRLLERSGVEVRAVLADGSEFPSAGKLDFVDNTVDPNAGTLRVRAVFQNPDRALLPGQYAKLRVLVAATSPPS